MPKVDLENQEIILIIGRDGLIDWWACDPVWQDNNYVATRVEQAAIVIRENGPGTANPLPGET